MKRAWLNSFNTDFKVNQAYRLSLRQRRIRKGLAPDIFCLGRKCTTHLNSMRHWIFHFILHTECEWHLNISFNVFMCHFSVSEYQERGIDPTLLLMSLHLHPVRTQQNICICLTALEWKSYVSYHCPVLSPHCPHYLNNLVSRMFHSPQQVATTETVIVTCLIK